MQHFEPELTALDQVIWSRTEGTQVQDGDLDYGLLVDAARRIGTVQVVVETIFVQSGNPLSLIGPENIAGQVEFNGAGFRMFHDARGPFVLGCLPTGHEGIFHLVGSIPTTDPRWRRVERWVGKASADVSPCFLNHDEFSEVGSSLSALGDVEVSRMTAKKRLDSSSLARGWPKRDGELRPSHLQAIAEAEAEGASVRTLTLTIQHEIKVHLRRVAGATLYWGSFQKFSDLVLDKLAASASRRRSLLAGRNREISVAPPIPIVVQLGYPLLADSAATGQLLRVLERESSIAIGVMHRNPYLHAIVTDYTDGSNFDLFVTKADQVEIHPGFRASMGSLARLTQIISDRFDGDEIQEASTPVLVTLDDLAGLA